jgi:hypothetical protein
LRASLESVERIGISGAHQGDGFIAHINRHPDVDHWLARSVSRSCYCDSELKVKG